MSRPINIPESFRKQADKLSLKSLAVDFNISERTALNWRNSLGIKPPKSNAIDHKRLRDLILEGKSNMEIMARLGCGKSICNEFRRKMGMGSGVKRLRRDRQVSQPVVCKSIRGAAYRRKDVIGSPTRTVICLCCDLPFESTHKGNRLCCSCLQNANDEEYECVECVEG